MAQRKLFPVDSAQWGKLAFGEGNAAGTTCKSERSGGKFIIRFAAVWDLFRSGIGWEVGSAMVGDPERKCAADCS